MYYIKEKLCQYDNHGTTSEDCFKKIGLLKHRVLEVVLHVTMKLCTLSDS
jgi:hypothetical protein